MNRSRMAFALGLAAPFLVLGGCSDDPVPKVAPHESPSVVSESPSPTGPDRGPVATVRAWVSAQNAAMRSGRTDRVRALSTSDCASCDGLVDPIDKVYASGGYFHTKGWTVDAAKVANSSGAGVKVNAAITIRGGKTLNSKGEQPVSYEVDRRIAVFKLIREQNEWLVSFIGFIS